MVQQRFLLLAAVALLAALTAGPARSQVPDEAIASRSGCYEINWDGDLLPEELKELERAVWLTPAPFAGPEVLKVDSWQLYVARPAPGAVGSPYAVVGWRVFEDTIIVRWHGGPGIGISIEVAESNQGLYIGTARIFSDQLDVQRTPWAVSMVPLAC